MSLQVLLENKNETYYWIGFLMADGWMDHSRGKLFLCLAEKDKEHLDKFAKFIGSNVSSKGKQVITTKGDVFILPLISEKYCFNENKTYNPPDKIEIENDDLFMSFLIGYIDGDGYISTVKNIGVECNVNWMQCLNRWFERVWLLAGCVEDHNTHKKPIARLRKSRGKQTNQDTCVIQTCNKRFVGFLKRKSVELQLPCLQRKWGRI